MTLETTLIGGGYCHGLDARSSINFGLAQCLRSGITTVVEIGADGDGDAYTAAVEEAGIRSYVGLSYRNASMYPKPNGSIGYLGEYVVDVSVQCTTRARRGRVPSRRRSLLVVHGRPYGSRAASSLLSTRPISSVSLRKMGPQPGTTFAIGIQRADRSGRSFRRPAR